MQKQVLYALVVCSFMVLCWSLDSEYPIHEVNLPRFVKKMLMAQRLAEKEGEFSSPKIEATLSTSYTLPLASNTDRRETTILSVLFTNPKMELPNNSRATTTTPLSFSGSFPAKTTHSVVPYSSPSDLGWNPFYKWVNEFLLADLGAVVSTPVGVSLLVITFTGKLNEILSQP